MFPVGSLSLSLFLFWYRNFCSFVHLFSNLGFGEASPEAKAAKNLHNFFTYVAVRIVIAQLEVFLQLPF